MNQKILSAAIAGALAGSMAFAANADVTLYGQVDLSLDARDIDGASDDINMNSNQSAIGVKGSEDLGNGLKAIFLLEYEIDPSGSDTSASTLYTGRDQWIGLQGSNWGKLRFGTASTTYKAHSAAIDPFYRTSLQGRNNGLQSRLHSQAGANGEGRMTNAIHYDTPDFNGFGASANYSFDDTCNAASGSGCVDDDAYSLGAKYSNGPLLAYVSYVTSDKGGDDDATQIGGKYSFGDFAVYAQYEIDGGLIAGNTTTVNQSNDGADLWHIGGSFTMGNAMLYAAYGQGDDDSSATFNTEYDAWTIAGMYNFSKRTMAYAGFNQVSCDAGGWSNNATSSCANVGASGGENDIFTLGMRHKF
ncbi:MAG: porin [Thiohalobacteraceae bacterium]